jgi:hypothetical protein
VIEFFTANTSAIAAIASTFATLFAAFATWHGPRSAAKLAEEIRKNTEMNNENRRMKLLVFSTLMQERATIASIDSVKMLNSIDFVFSESPKVREAWADLYSIFHTQDSIHPQLREDKTRVLLKEMIADIGLSDKLKVDDISRIYYPNALAQADEIESHRRMEALSHMRRLGNDAVEESSSVELLTRKFPPKPATQIS